MTLSPLSLSLRRDTRPGGHALPGRCAAPEIPRNYPVLGVDSGALLVLVTWPTALLRPAQPRKSPEWPQPNYHPAPKGPRFQATGRSARLSVFGLASRATKQARRRAGLC